jgi:hypothetical protein
MIDAKPTIGLPSQSAELCAPSKAVMSRKWSRPVVAVGWRPSLQVVAQIHLRRRERCLAGTLPPAKY